jgi:hypothetical protein
VLSTPVLRVRLVEAESMRTKSIKGIFQSPRYSQLNDEFRNAEVLSGIDCVRKFLQEHFPATGVQSILAAQSGDRRERRYAPYSAEPLFEVFQDQFADSIPGW